MEPKILYAVVDTEADGRRILAPLSGALQADGTAKILTDFTVPEDLISLGDLSTSANKVVPAAADKFLIVDSANPGVLTTITFANLQAAIKTPYTLGAAWSGSGAALVAAGADKVVQRVPIAGTITKCLVLCLGGPGSVQIDIWRSAEAGTYPPVIGGSIVGSAYPTVTSAHRSTDATLTGWAKTLTAGDNLLFVLNSASTVTSAQIILEISP